MFAADLYYHRSCIATYIRKAKRTNERKESFDTNYLESTSKRKIFAGYFDTIRNILDQGKGMTISDIRDLIKSEIPDVDFHNS